MRAKREVRDIQRRTDWPYQATKFIVEQLGYEVVSDAVDRLPVEGEGLDGLRAELAKRARDKAKTPSS